MQQFSFNYQFIKITNIHTNLNTVILTYRWFQNIAITIILWCYQGKWGNFHPRVILNCNPLAPPTESSIKFSLKLLYQINQYNGRIHVYDLSYVCLKLRQKSVNALWQLSSAKQKQIHSVAAASLRERERGGRVTLSDGANRSWLTTY